MQIVSNLLENAINYSQAGGQVALRYQKEDASLILSVEDHGVGIAPEQLVSIFEPLHQANPGPTRKYGVLGLGLSITKSLVELHRGRVWGRSEVNQGSTFFVELPLRQPGHP